MLLLSVNWSHVWLVTLLGFGIVLLLLVFLIFVMTIFGWVMQTLNKPAAPKAAKVETKKVETAPAGEAEAAAVAVAMAKGADTDMAAVAMALNLANGGDKAAIAMALYLSRGIKSFPNPTMPSQARNTAWNAKSYNMNNLGF